MKKAIATILFLAVTSFGFCQSVDPLKKGNTVYLENNSANDHAKELQEDLVTRLNEWGYWKLANNKNDADFVMKLSSEARRGITATSWGGTSVVAKITLVSKSGQTVWESDEFTSSPNGTNGFNSTNAVAKKIMRLLKKKFK